MLEITDFQEIDELLDELEAGTLTPAEAAQKLEAARQFCARMYQSFTAMKQAYTRQAETEQHAADIVNKLFQQEDKTS
jgi:predicted RNA-binding protein associated with RNAse of E/G family